jgi:hypothetical protein
MSGNNRICQVTSCYLILYQVRIGHDGSGYVISVLVTLGHVLSGKVSLYHDSSG